MLGSLNLCGIVSRMIGLALVLVLCPYASGAGDKDKALMEACEKGNLKEAQRLIDEGANVNTKDNKRLTPLMLACGYQGQIKSKDKSGKALLPVSGKSNPELVILLVEKGANVNAKDDYGATPLMAACGYVQLAKNVDGQKMAFRPASPEIVKLLLEKGADITAKDRDGVTPLLAACGFKQSFQTTDANVRTTTIVSRPGHPLVVKILLEKGANSSPKDKFGLTPLLVAVIKNDPESVKALLEKGAQVNEKDKASKTPLVWAAENGRLDPVKLLLDKNADIHVNDVDAMTPFMRAAYNGHTKVAQMLLEKGSNLNKRSKRGQTALMVAAENGHTETVTFLLDKGADFRAKDNAGRTAFALAQKKKHQEVVEVLRKRGASK